MQAAFVIEKATPGTGGSERDAWQQGWYTIKKYPTSSITIGMHSTNDGDVRLLRSGL
jgi:hypothetical protein